MIRIYGCQGPRPFPEAVQGCASDEATVDRFIHRREELQQGPLKHDRTARMHSTEETNVSETEGTPAKGSRWILALLFLPALVCGWLVKGHSVNTLHYDDFTFAEDWLHYRTGTLTLRDLFSVHLEHRVTVPRVLALGAHLLGGADVRWQNGFTVLLLIGTYCNLLVLWRRTARCGWCAGWLPLLLMSSTLFCAVQWQPLLWPILFEIFVGVFALSLMLRLWSGTMNPWLVLFFSVLLCDAALLSFGNGPLTWLLLPLAIWFQRPGLDRRLRRKLLATWLGLFVVTMLFYFHNFHNSAPKQFAYNFGEEMTAAETVGSSLKQFLDIASLPKVVDFFFTVLGSHLCRGLHINNLFAALWIGGISFTLFVLALITLFIRRRDRELLRSAAPWVLLGLYSTGTAALITIGRVWLTRSGNVALLPRYLSHAVPLTIALIALASILLRDASVRRPCLGTVGVAASGFFFGLVCIEWIYGIRQMDSWRNARLQTKAMLHFADVIPDKQYLGPVSGDGAYGAKVITALDGIKQSPSPLAHSLNLRELFHVSSLTLRHRQAGFNELHDTAKGGLFAIGFSELPDQRPADLILFTTPDETGAEQIFGLTFALRLPNFIHSSTQKDNDGCSMDDIDPDMYSRWQGDITLVKKPAREAHVTAWALDIERHTVYRIPDNRSTGEPLPPLPPAPVDVD